MGKDGGQTESLDAKQQETGEPFGIPSLDSPLAALEQKELAAVLAQLLAELKPPQGDLLADFFLHGLSYEEMAKKHGLAIGSVGVYLKRGLESIRRAWERKGER